MVSTPAGPHGGPLKNLVVEDARKEVLREIGNNLPDIVLNDRQLCDFELLACGAFSPLEGFMTKPDYESVLDRMRLQNDVLWPLPVCLDISETVARPLEAGQSLSLRDPEGFLLGVLHVEDLWPVDRNKEFQKVFGTADSGHPGVRALSGHLEDVYIGGRLEVVSLPLHFDFLQLRQTPEEVRRTFRKLGWQRVVGFQTSNPIHRPQFEMTLKAMRQARANLLVLPSAGMARPGDFDHYTRVRCLRGIQHRYPPDAFLINLLPLAARMAGPRDALLHTIIARNYGCTHFIVGHGHANPEPMTDGRQYYGDDDAKELTTRLAGEIGIEVIPFKEMVYLPFEDEYRFADQVPEGSQTVSLSGTDIRGRIRQGRNIPMWATFEEVVEELRKAYPLPRKQGFTVFLTGLSGAGKSTIAKILYSRFLEIGERPVSLLDGDIVRRNLSSELSFSKEHRDINVLRIGFVASEITKNRGIAICAPIAPYQHTRREVRRIIEEHGGFVEVHVSTPIEECERRDRKGMYAKARAGLIKGFTGVDDPYEEPVNAEVGINTTHMEPDEAAREILLYLGERGYM